MSNNEIIMDYIIHNGKPVDLSDFDYSKTKTLPGVYEVIRIIDGVPLFLEMHISRFRKSAGLLGFKIHSTDDEISKQIKDLLNINNCSLGNVKIVINRLDSDSQDNYVFFVKSKYPSQEQVQNGVPVILCHAERQNPNAKSTNLSFREKIDDEIKQAGVYEALLVNKNNEITEGSKSNFFAVIGDTLYTSPVKNVLPGVTRHVVLDLCGNLNFKVAESLVTVDMLKSIDGLFITGTSPQVLPISSVDKISFSSASNDIVIKLRTSYENAVKEYIDSHK
jgi:branched-chain amino acid aminotransferase